MAIVMCGRCGKGYSDKVYPACPVCGGGPDSTPMREEYVAPRGLAPGAPQASGSPASPGLVLVGVVALGLIGYGLIKAVRSTGSAPQAAPAPAVTRLPSGTAANPWADRVEAGVRAMSVGQCGVDLAQGAVRCLHGSVQRAYVSGSSVARVGKDAAVSFSFTWFDQQGTPRQTSVDWVLSESLGHVQARLSSDSSPDPAVYRGERALNHYFRGSAYPALMSRMSGQPGPAIGPTSTEITAPPLDQLTNPQPAQPASRPRRRRPQ
jgi:hypothetical protein